MFIIYFDIDISGFRVFANSGNARVFEKSICVFVIEDFAFETSDIAITGLESDFESADLVLKGFELVLVGGRGGLCLGLWVGLGGGHRGRSGRERGGWKGRGEGGKGWEGKGMEWFWQGEKLGKRRWEWMRGRAIGFARGGQRRSGRWMEGTRMELDWVIDWMNVYEGERKEL